MVLPLADNNKRHEFGYEIHVYTGMKSGAGTKSKVNFILGGTKSDTGIRIMDDGLRKVRH